VSPSHIRLSHSAIAQVLSILMLALLAHTAAVADVPIPKVPKGKGDHCVEDTEFMRKNHMELLLHQRDETMHRGIRTKKYSLENCLDCHAVKGDDNQPVGADDPRHFCNSCHGYVAVKIDCFGCHPSKPDMSSIGSR
jgi:hypothetical protein